MSMGTVHCRYPKCSKLHESNELNKKDAVQVGKNSYYHPDCYHMTKTIGEIKDLFVKEINPLMTGSQIGILVSTINNIVYSKKVDIDYLKFAVQYFIKYKPGSLKHPYGLHYIVQNAYVESAWKKEQERKLKAEIKSQLTNIDKLEGINLTEDKGEIGGWIIPDNNEFTYVPPKQKGFADILH